MRRHRGEHPTRLHLVEERVHHQRLAVADDQARVGLTPATVGLHPRVQTGTDFAQPTIVPGGGAGQRPSHRASARSASIDRNLLSCCTHVKQGGARVHWEPQSWRRPSRSQIRRAV